MASCYTNCVYFIITSYIDMKSSGFYEGKNVCRELIFLRVFCKRAEVKC